MSRRSVEELKALATRVAVEATGRERARCVWVLDRMLQQAQAGLEKKLMAAAELQLAQVRFELTKTIVTAAKALILSDARPQKATATPAPGQNAQPGPGGPPSEIIVP
jgi:hypothetical protein